MRCARAFALALCLLIATACVHQHRSTDSLNHLKWTNLYEGDPKLAGIEIRQFPEGNPYEPELDYTNQHPGIVGYFFWDGSVRMMKFLPAGKVVEDFWWADKLKSGDEYWSAVDFSYGSDKEFKRHPDPRKSSR